MKFITQHTQLAEHLYRLQGIASSKTTMPILSHVLMVAKQDGTLTLAATDLDLAIEDKLSVQVEREGAIAIHAKNFFDIVKAAPPGEIRIELTDNHRLEINAGQAQFKLVGSAAQEFPALPNAATTRTFPLIANDLASMIDGTVFCVSTDDSRYNLSGVFWEGLGESGTLRLVATDGHRLALSEREVKASLKGLAAIVPRKTLVELRRVLGTFENSEKATIDCSFSENHVIFRSESMMLISRLVEGLYPDYEQVIPKNADKIVRVARQEFIDALKRVAILAPDKSFCVRLELGEKVLRIESQNPELGEAKQEIAAEYSGKPLVIGFNAHYLLDGLNLISEGGVRLELSDALAPIVMRPLESRHFTAVVMPMRI